MGWEWGYVRAWVGSCGGCVRWWGGVRRYVVDWGVGVQLHRCVHLLPHRFLQLEKELVEVDQMVKDADGDQGQLFSSG